MTLYLPHPCTDCFSLLIVCWSHTVHFHALIHSLPFFRTSRMHDAEAAKVLQHCGALFTSWRLHRQVPSATLVLAWEKKIYLMDVPLAGLPGAAPSEGQAATPRGPTGPAPARVLKSWASEHTVSLCCPSSI